ncbi:Pheromone-processing carboxypeptidase KEX1 [Trichoderma lentiforme]|uniref:Pheromone-processing carboxypeptidase KEX1 n=1 Tax=Trichoderma lentiforme TaxID=1567552 RepID=A0A9P4X776_9HYPO|nr:Pheromone-processing carboxypeptidase KEX1 [Trichoderma lentiforme]
MVSLSARPASWRWLAVTLASLWPALAVAEQSKTTADYYVHDLPGLPQNAPAVKMHAGHIEITPEHNGNLFFWHFQNQHIANRQRTVVWLNGGPGCSSEDGAMMEIGPYRVKDENTLVPNNGSWHEFANLLFVDNPVGAGFSYVDTDSYLRELNEMADQFVIFLEKFFTLFPEYEHDDLYFAGESYAGQYIPYIAKAIVDRNKKLSEQKKDKDTWNLKGLLIGNGWISPREQYDSYLPFAFEKGLLTKDGDVAKKLQSSTRICQNKQGSDPGHVDYGECESILSSILDMTRKGNGNDACWNMYDVRLRDSFPSCGMNWPPDLAAVTPYLRRQDVVKALHINPANAGNGWQECSGAVSSTFKARTSVPSVELLPGLLTEIPILLFSGAEDLICNHIGTENMIDNMEWNGGKGFEITPGNWAPRRKWTFEGEVAGFWQEARNLTYVLFYNSSHMVPFDYPRRTRDMLDRFMGVDISSIGGEPTDSRIDGEKGIETTVGGASNNTHAHEEETHQKIDDAKWAAYQRSGEIVLVIVIVAAGAWGYFIWRQRRARAAYRALSGSDPSSRNGSRLNFSSRSRRHADVEAADFDETTLDDLHVETPTASESKYTVGGDDESDDGLSEAEQKRRKANQGGSS